MAKCLFRIYGWILARTAFRARDSRWYTRFDLLGPSNMVGRGCRIRPDEGRTVGAWQSRTGSREKLEDPSQLGKGNWAGFTLSLDAVYEAAAERRQALVGVGRPWLCWNVSDRRCTVQ